MVKNPPANAGNVRDSGLIPESEDPLEEGMGTHSSIPGESHGKRSLAGYSPWGCKESDTAEVTEHSRDNVINKELHNVRLF